MAHVDEIQDIVDLIVDHLVEIIQQELIQWHPGTELRLTYPVSNELHELKQCALINKAFAFRSQKHLFSTLKIWVQRVQLGIPNAYVVAAKQEPILAKDAQRAINNLLRIFDYKPYLARHLQTIEIPPEFRGLVRQYDSLRKLLGVLQRQGNPRNLIFAGMYYHRSKPLDYGFQEFIGTHLQFMKCRYLYKMPTSFLVKNTKLQALELDACSGWSILEGAPQITAAPQPRIRSLSLSSSWTVLDSMLEEDESGQLALNFSDLIYLHLIPTSNDADVLAVQRLLFIAGPSLEEMTMSTVVSGPQSYSSRLDLSLCSKLRTARLLTTIHSNIDVIDTSPFDRFLGTLSTISCPNMMENLELEVYLPIDTHNWRQAYTSLKWETMDEELYRISNTSTASVYGSRKTFILHIIFYGIYIEEEGDREDDDIQECQQFTSELNRRFQLTFASDERIRFHIKHSVAVDHLNFQMLG